MKWQKFIGLMVKAGQWLVDRIRHGVYRLVHAERQGGLSLGRKTHSVVTVAAAAVLLIGGGVLMLYQRSYATSQVPVTGYATVVVSGDKLNFDDSQSNVTIDNFSRQMDGFVWDDNAGWISFGVNSNPAGPVTAGVDGVLAGKAKALNAGELDFSGSGSHVQVSNGSFSGYVWSDDVGWIDFSNVRAVGYDPDLTPPSNASDIILHKTNGGLAVTTGGWTNTNGYFSWTAATDNSGGSGVLGYCLYLGSDSTGDPHTSKGMLGNSLLDTGGACPFAVSGTSVDLNQIGLLAQSLTTSAQPYYLNIKALDSSKNIFGGASESFSFKYDNVAPDNPLFITAPSQFLSSKKVTLMWTTSGSDAAQDDTSGVKGLQYRIGDNGKWYGANHTGTEDETDVLPNNGSYTTVDPIDYDQLVQGSNIVAFRTIDTAGNIASTEVTTVIKINTSAPSEPQSLAVTPSSSTTNNFAFTWSAPATFEGYVGSMTYCYSVNIVPSSSSCTYTEPGVTALPSGAYATQPGDNTLYVVARDEAGNINYGTAASVHFTANTSAPGVPLTVDIADISVKAVSSWKLALSWEQPASVGSGVTMYRVWRSTDNQNFTMVATTGGTSYVDTNLTQSRYFYKVQACDSANNCGAQSGVVDIVPTGRYTSPAELVSSPVVQVRTRSVVISWITDRESDSRVQLGEASGSYFDAETAKSDQVKDHSIEINNLQPGTKYYYKARWTDEDGNTGQSSELIFQTLPAPTVRNVTVGQIGLDTANLSFTSKDATKVTIYYGVSDSFGGNKSINTSTVESSYTVNLDNLNDGTKYYFKINTIDSEGNEYDSGRIDSFQTPPRPRISDLTFQPVDGQPTSTQKISWQTNVPTTSLLRYEANGQPEREVSSSKMTTEHSLVIEGLEDDSLYTVTAVSSDSLGNQAVSDKQSFRTALDTRPPKVSGLRVETSVRGVGNEARGQLVVSWKTDEPATSQVAYGKGSSGSHYSSNTSEDGVLAMEHTVVISDLDTSQVYHLQVVSRDKSSNVGKSDDRSAIIGQASDSVIDIILGTLEKIFGL
jgi:hypothetical protein